MVVAQKLSSMMLLLPNAAVLMPGLLFLLLLFHFHAFILLVLLIAFYVPGTGSTFAPYKTYERAAFVEITPVVLMST